MCFDDGRDFVQNLPKLAIFTVTLFFKLFDINSGADLKVDF